MLVLLILLLPHPSISVEPRDVGEVFKQDDRRLGTVYKSAEAWKKAAVDAVAHGCQQFRQRDGKWRKQAIQEYGDNLQSLGRRLEVLGGRKAEPAADCRAPSNSMRAFECMLELKYQQLQQDFSEFHNVDMCKGTTESLGQLRMEAIKRRDAAYWARYKLNDERRSVERKHGTFSDEKRKGELSPFRQAPGRVLFECGYKAINALNKMQTHHRALVRAFRAFEQELGQAGDTIQQQITQFAETQKIIRCASANDPLP